MSTVAFHCEIAKLRAEITRLRNDLEARATTLEQIAMLVGSGQQFTLMRCADDRGRTRLVVGACPTSNFITSPR